MPKKQKSKSSEYEVVKNFDSRVAKLVGTDAAIVLNNILYWCDFNRANGKNYHDGHYWTFNTYSAFQKQFYWLSYDKIRGILNRLKDKGFVKVGNYNKHKYDRTLWYTTTRDMWKKSQMVSGSLPNAFGSLPTPIPNKNKDKKLSGKHYSSSKETGSSGADNEASFLSRDQEGSNSISSSRSKLSTGVSQEHKPAMSKRLATDSDPYFFQAFEENLGKPYQWPEDMQDPDIISQLRELEGWHGDRKDLVDEYFEQKFREKTNYRVYHFLSEGVQNRLQWKTM